MLLDIIYTNIRQLYVFKYNFTKISILYANTYKNINYLISKYIKADFELNMGVNNTHYDNLTI
jgi:hypothetical protein